MTLQEFKSRYPDYEAYDDQILLDYLKGKGVVGEGDVIDDSKTSAIDWNSRELGNDRIGLANSTLRKGTTAENQRRLEQQQGIDRRATNAYYGAGLANTVAGMSQALTQQARGRQQLAELQRNIPQTPEFLRNQRLQQELGMAQRRTETGMDPATRALMMEQAQQAQDASMRGAYTAGGGQAGLTGAMMQAAGPNRWRMALQMAQADQQARLGNRADYRSLMNMESGEDSALRAYRDADFQRRYGRHMANMKSAQQLQAAGGINQANIMSTMPNQAYNTIKNMPWLQGGTQQPQYTTGSTFQQNNSMGLPEYNPYDTYRRDIMD